MRLEHLTAAHVRRAVEIYIEHAFEGASADKARAKLAALEDATTLEQLLERLERGADENVPRYMLRLGNSRYPFMKFVVQEFLVVGEYFFSVDTHDNLEIKPGAPDYAEWEELKVWNRALKRRIEEAWHESGLPTNADLRTLAQDLARMEKRPDAEARILVVDDERDVALGLQALLKARGYAVELAADGREAMARLERDPLPDLVLLDYEMPELDGEEVLRRMREDERLADVAVLFATASSFDLSRLRRISGYLQKPYPRQVLFAMLERLLADRRRADVEGGDAEEPGAPAE